MTFYKVSNPFSQGIPEELFQMLEGAMIEKAHFKQAGLSDAQFEMHFGGGVLAWLQGLLKKVSALGPAGLALAQQTVTDVTSGNWLAVAADVMKLVQMFNQSQPGTAL